MCKVTIEIEAYQMPYLIQAVSAPVLSQPPKIHIHILESACLSGVIIGLVPA